jgi:hypothetical protein
MNHPTKTLSNLSILGFSFVILVVIISLATSNHYGRSNAEVAHLLEQDFLVTPQLLKEKQGEYLLIDVRGEEQYQQAHLTGALNIPFNRLLDKNSIRLMERTEGKIPVLYAEKESAAHEALYMLLSAGIKTTPLVLAGDYVPAGTMSGQEAALSPGSSEAARHEYKLFRNAAPAEVSSAKTIIPKMQAPAANVKGGC